MTEKIEGFYLDGTEYEIGGAEYNAGEGIGIGTVQDYSAMQGPCPSGFHVPSSTEWTAVKTVWTTLGGGDRDGSNFGIALKLPFAGYRNRVNPNVNDQGSYGYYWSSSRYNAGNAYYIYFHSSTITPPSNNYRAYGYPVRGFKDSPVVPDNTWTKLYGTSIEAGGVFRSSSLGLISMSSDGTTWITIADKNLGATTVWNNGDTLSEANCGGYFQWGNNYMFPFTGTIANQSTTQVDASNYGPGNYYSSDTYIKYSGRWDTTDNGNLWGGVTGVITLDNAITNIGVLSVNGQTGDVTVSSGAEIVYVTQAEYDALPSSKLTDGKHYFIYEGVTLKTYEEIVAMATAEGQPRTNTIAELNSNAEAYYNMLNDGNHMVTKTDAPGDETINCIDGICNAVGVSTKLIYYENSLFYSKDFIGSLC